MTHVSTVLFLIVFLHRGPELWSKILSDIKDFKSKEGFAKKVKKLF